MTKLLEVTYDLTQDSFRFWSQDEREGKSHQGVGMQYWYTKFLASSLTLLHGYHGLHRATKDVTSVCDLFAGVGVSAMILKKYHPELTRYLAIDYDASALESFKLNNPWVKPAALRCGDSYEYGVEVLMSGTPDYVLAEFNATSYLRLCEDPREKKLHDAIFTHSRPRYVLLADSAMNKIHLHHENYSKRFGHKVTSPETYVEAVSRDLTRKHGYGIRRAYRDAYVGLYLLERSYSSDKIALADLRDSVDPKRAKIQEVTL